MTGANWGGEIRCAHCGVYARTNVAELLDSSDVWVCVDCETHDDLEEIDLEEIGQVLFDLTHDDTVGMPRLL